MDAQRLAEATARRWFRTLEPRIRHRPLDERSSVLHLRWMTAERAVVLLREGDLAPPPSRRS